MKILLGAQPSFSGSVKEILSEVREVLTSGHMTEGKYIERFGKGFQDRMAVQYATAVSSGGAALELILEAIGVRGKEVIVPTDTFVATAFSVIRARGTLVLADIEKNTLAPSKRTIESLITEKTVAVIIVHMFGVMSSQIGELQSLCADRGIALIEDAAHAHGASYHGMRAGSLGHAAAFSFYPTKMMTTGEGGMVTTNHRDLNESVRQMRTYGKKIGGTDFTFIGANFRLAEIPAILGYHQLLDLEENVERRNAIAKKYVEAFRAMGDVELLEPDKQSRHSFWRFPLYLDARIDRRALQKKMADEFGVRITWMYEPLCHLQPALRDRYGYKEGDFPQAEECMRRLICLPTHMGMRDGDGERVIAGMKRCLQVCRV